ncbi:MAG: LysR substrate-binding domain-containing protein, partial [Phycisphaeraceae bacterium]
RIGQLEKRLGAKLIDRSVRPLALTQAGELFLREARELVERYNRLEQRIGRIGTDGSAVQEGDAGAQPQGLVTVAAIYSAGIGLLNFVRDKFVAEYPRVSVTLDYKHPDDVFETVRRRQCDLGILSYPERWRGLGVIPLRNEVMAVVCSPRHTLARRAKVKARELGRWPMASFETRLPVGRRIRRYLKDQGVRPRFASVFDNIDTIKAALGVTDQVAILPKRTVLREVAAGTLAVVELEPELLRPIAIVYRKPRGSNGPNGNGTTNDAAHSDDTAARTGNGQGGNGDITGVFSPSAQAFVDFLLKHAGPNVATVDPVEARGRELVGGKV